MALTKLLILTMATIVGLTSVRAFNFLTIKPSRAFLKSMSGRVDTSKILQGQRFSTDGHGTGRTPGKAKRRLVQDVIDDN